MHTVLEQKEEEKTNTPAIVVKFLVTATQTASKITPGVQILQKHSPHKEKVHKLRCRPIIDFRFSS
jgi:hypothetical protein